MIIPIRCFSCGKCIADKWEKYKLLLEEGLEKVEALESVGLRRYCCKRMFLGHVELIDKLLLYQKNDDTVPNK